MLAEHLRIIPALAGNTLRWHWRDRRSGDHPRSRGEYPVALFPREMGSGSSPLSRGILSGHLARCGVVWIIPALAGNTNSRLSSVSTAADHPRSRGEYDIRGYPDGVHSGSSPLSRGILYHHWMPRKLRRIIPALAGNTPTISIRSYVAWDHPRSRGEYPRELPSGTTGVGSSPLSRGIPAPSRGPVPAEGIIPALAGNTCLSDILTPHNRDHPRSRGEYAGGVGWNTPKVGSSPLSRGIPYGT